MPSLWRCLIGLTLLLTSPVLAAPVCEPGKGYVAADTAQQVSEEFLLKLKGAGIDTIIRYCDWVEETLPGKTLTRRERDLIAKAGLSVAVIFQHHNDCLYTFMTMGRGGRDEGEHADVNRRRVHPLEGAPNFGIPAVIATSES
jgi:hypothetical protein